MHSRFFFYFFFFLVFFFICYFFIKIHPLYVFDTDDWAYIQDSRNGKAWPVWGGWNPTRVFPEIFMPAISWLSVIFIYPFNADYIESLSIGFGVTLSFFVIILGILLSKFFERFFDLSHFESSCFSFFFILLLFYPLYRHSDQYLLRSVNVTCIFYYTIPALLNSAVVTGLLSLRIDNKLSNETNCITLSFLIVAVYFSLNSNLFESIVLFSFASATLIISFYKENNKESCSFFYRILTSIKNSILNNQLFFFIAIAYLVILVYEANGGRASGYNKGVFDLDIKASFITFIQSLGKLQQFYYYFFILNLIGITLYFLRKQKNYLTIMDRGFIGLFLKLLFSFIITAVFLIFLCAKTGAGYLKRTDVELSYFFYILLFSLCSLVYIYKCISFRLRIVKCFLPLLIILMLSKIVFYNVRYAETSMAQFPIVVGKHISDDLISQIIKADKVGNTEVELFVPEFIGPTNDNWPLALYGAQRLSAALYSHRIIHREIYVKFIPDKAVNVKYKID